MFDQREAVVGEHVGRIRRGVVRLGAVAVGAQVRHDHAIALRGELFGVAVAQPVDLRGGEIAVDEDQRPAVAEFAVGELQAVAAVKMLNGKVDRGIAHGVWRSLWNECVMPLIVACSRVLRWHEVSYLL